MSTNYHSLRFLASDDPGDGQLKPLYESVAQHHPDRVVLSGAPEVIPFGVNFAGKLSDSALASYISNNHIYTSQNGQNTILTEAKF